MANKEPKYDVMIIVKADKRGYQAHIPCVQVSMNQAIKEAKRTADETNYAHGAPVVESINITFKRVR